MPKPYNGLKFLQALQKQCLLNGSGGVQDPWLVFGGANKDEVHLRVSDLKSKSKTKHDTVYMNKVSADNVRHQLLNYSFQYLGRLDGTKDAIWNRYKLSDKDGTSFFSATTDLSQFSAARPDRSNRTSAPKQDLPVPRTSALQPPDEKSDDDDDSEGPIYKSDSEEDEAEKETQAIQSFISRVQSRRSARPITRAPAPVASPPRHRPVPRARKAADKTTPAYRIVRTSSGAASGVRVPITPPQPLSREERLVQENKALREYIVRIREDVGRIREGFRRAGCLPLDD